MVSGTVSLMLREPLVQLRTRTWREPSALAFDTQSKPATVHGRPFRSKQRAPGRERRPKRRRTSCARAQLTPSTSTSATVSWPGETWIARGSQSRAALAGRAGASACCFGEEPQPATSTSANAKTGRTVQRNRAAAYPGARRRAEDGASIGE